MNIVIGIVSGILTSAVIFLAVRMFQLVVIPWYRELVYRGIDVSGEWESRIELGPGVYQTASIVLNQSAERVRRTITLVKVRGNRTTPAEQLALEGQLSNRFLVGTMRPTDSKRLVAVTVLLEVVGDGRRMKGWTAWYDSKEAVVTGEESQWVRAEANRNWSELPDGPRQPKTGSEVLDLPEIADTAGRG